MSVSLAALMVVGGLTAAPGSAGGPVACPTALPTSQAVDGLKGTGYTVERGTTPAPFTATVLGRITNGIGPGVDMIMAELDSPAIQRAGVWSGMSGSPVYTKDGKLIGAVAYGLSWSPSPIAGITPATQMKDLLKLGTAGAATPEAAAAAAGPEQVPVPAAAAKRIAATGEATTAQASGGFVRLKVPVTVSGLSGASAPQTQKMLDRLSDKMPGARLVLGASAPSSGSSATQIRAGGNFAAAISYGDFTAAGTGTTTFVCGGRAVAFGHPFLFSGNSSMSVHPASAVYVQVDNTMGSFKVANPGGPVGTLDQDRLAGIRGQLGTLPKTATIRSELTVVGGGSRTGTTHLVYQPYGAVAAANHTLFNFQTVLDSDTAGTADVTLQVKGVRPNGQAFTLTRAEKYADPQSIGFAVADSVYMTVEQIVNQPFEKVRITSITLKGTVDPNYRGYKVGSVKVRQGGTYVVPNGPVQAKAGSTLPIRLQLVPLGGGTGRNLDLALPVPAGAIGGTAMVEAGPQFIDTSSATSFPQVLQLLRAAPPANSGRATLDAIVPGGTKITSVNATTDRAILNYEYGFDVEVN